MGPMPVLPGFNISLISAREPAFHLAVAFDREETTYDFCKSTRDLPVTNEFSSTNSGTATLVISGAKGS